MATNSLAGTTSPSGGLSLDQLKQMKDAQVQQQLEQQMRQQQQARQLTPEQMQMIMQQQAAMAAAAQPAIKDLAEEEDIVVEPKKSSMSPGIKELIILLVIIFLTFQPFVRDGLSRYLPGAVDAGKTTMFGVLLLSVIAVLIYAGVKRFL